MDKGRILQIDTPRALYEEPADLTVARFIGTPTINSWAIDLDGTGRFQDFSGVYACQGNLVGKVTLGLRPEHILVASDGIFEHPVDIHTHVRVRRSDIQGPEWLLQLHSESTPAISLQARIGHRQLHRTPVCGDRLKIGWNAQDVLLFDAGGLRLKNQVIPFNRLMT
jgi:multiple sugar transport system ATP-binding protein